MGGDGTAAITLNLKDEDERALSVAVGGAEDSKNTQTCVNAPGY